MLFRLRSGRLLEFAAYGSPLAPVAAANGNVINILYHHGWPSCRHEGAFLHPLGQELQLRILAVNRPGVGRSSFDAASYSFQSIADDVRQLLDGLGLDKVVFMGTSGGGPYACACACLLPERTSALCLVAGMTHTRDAPELLQGMALSNRLGFLAINHTPGLLGAAMGAGTAALRLAAALGVGPMRAVGGGGKAIVNDMYGSRSGGEAAEEDEPVQRSAKDVTVPPAGPAAAAAVAGGAAVAKPSASGAAGGGGGDSGYGGSGGAGLCRAALGAGLSAAATWLMLSAAGFSATDRAAVAEQLRQRPELGALMSRSGGEVLAQGLTGLWADMRLTSEPWGLPLERITAPTFIWQGDQDLNVTLAMARHLHDAIPGARGRLRVVHGAGHISLGLDHGREVLRALTEHLRGESGQRVGSGEAGG
ncbi:hypothetical protein PLESTB_000033300 [Pleodorina starrii]|uniref:AB hydrolase-1 domain-containing protein n=1 Tax=Pleodorina starrii TaxID=330485 RepID=A0A9W6B9R2_9CHLO|nr:hypothetical protein PLESTB_000033300 [Pleodorina starrii]GLC70711.1 hypothetical protein PLESTF_001025400 [Pleodorina starrii]